MSAEAMVLRFNGLDHFGCVVAKATSTYTNKIQRGTTDEISRGAGFVDDGGHPHN